MKKNKLLIALVTLSLLLQLNNKLYSQNKSDSTEVKNQKKTTINDNDKPEMTVLEVLPEFLNGQVELSKFRYKNIIYPKINHSYFI